MTAKILDGKAIAAEIRAQLSTEIKQLAKKPGLAVVLVGNNPASEVYVANKHKACKEVGIESTNHHLPDSVSQTQLINLVHELNQNPNVHGILIQSPLPKQIDESIIYEAIDPKKDVDGFHPYNVGRLAQRRPLLRPCTPFGIITLLNHAKIEIAGANAVVIGASNIVGRPMALEFLLAKSTVTVCHRFTKNLAEQVKSADILVAAIGNPGIIKTDWIKPNAVVIDVGMNRLANGTLIGDIDFATAKEKASWITPVPGGVGPMTVAMLLKNTVLAASL